MTISSALRRRVRPLLPLSISRALIRAAVARPRVLAIVNRTYNALSWKQKHYFGVATGSAFQGRASMPSTRQWHVVFAGRTITTPLTPPRSELDWDLAVSILGADREVKQTYETILSSDQRPDLFVDIGTSYGTHSLLFLAHGVRTISIEPNPVCYNYFEESARLSGVTADIRCFVVGDSHEAVQFVFPEGDTWNGSADPDVQKNLGETSRGRLLKLTVQQTTIDDLLGDEIGNRLLIKIDVEGFELRVLQGARRTLETKRPSVFFESWQNCALRPQLLSFFKERRYALFALPWVGKSQSPLSDAGFLQAVGMNFLALPVEHIH
jgi:FkbM family methyltransferase